MNQQDNQAPQPTKKMQYRSVFSFLLNRKYLLFLVSYQTVIDIFSQLASHFMKKVSPHSPLSFSSCFADADNHIFEIYVPTS